MGPNYDINRSKITDNNLPADLLIWVHSFPCHCFITVSIYMVSINENCLRIDIIFGGLCAGSFLLPLHNIYMNLVNILCVIKMFLVFIGSSVLCTDSIAVCVCFFLARWIRMTDVWVCIARSICNFRNRLTTTKKRVRLWLSTSRHFPKKKTEKQCTRIENLSKTF